MKGSKKYLAIRYLTQRDGWHTRLLPLEMLERRDLRDWATGREVALGILNAQAGTLNMRIVEVSEEEARRVEKGEEDIVFDSYGQVRAGIRTAHRGREGG